MTLSGAAIADLQRIYTKEFGVHITNTEAEQKGVALIKLLRGIYSQSAPVGWQRQKKGVYGRSN